MVKNLLTGLTVCLVACFLTLSASAQYSPNFQQIFTITESNGEGHSDFQALLTVDTQTPIGQGRMDSNGDDIRFSTDVCGTTFLPHWVEQGMNSSTTAIWVKLDTIAPNQSVDIVMYFGDNAAANTSDFNATFPNAIISGGSNVSPTAGGNIGWLDIGAGDTLFLPSGQVFDVYAQVVNIQGTIMGDGAGYTAGASATAGSGPGGGGTSSDAGSGGGSYGGLGGTGGFDNGDSPGNGGMTYGTTFMTDIDMGSGGGSSSNSLGGNGGGGLSIRGMNITISGNIHLDGAHGEMPGGSRGGGGGAGGGFLLEGNTVSITGTVYARGGDGSVGTSTANDSGGGGGGGRVKVYYDAGSTITYTAFINGGVGGPNGGGGSGQSGLGGSDFSQMVTFLPSTVSAGAQTPGAINTFTLTTTDPDTSICAGDSIAFQVNSGFNTYNFYVNNNLQQGGASNAWGSTALNDGDVIFADADGCTGSMTVTVNQPTPVNITANPSGPVCVGDTVELTGDGANASGHIWDGGIVGASIQVTTPDTFMVDYTDMNGCISSASYVVVMTQPIASIAGDSMACDGDVVTLTASGAPNYLWSTTETTASIDVTTTGTYDVTVTDANGCTDIESISVTFNPLPAPTLTFSGGTTIDAGAGYQSYQWYFNGALLGGQNMQTIDPLSNGDYHCVVIDDNGCEGSSDTVSFSLSIAELNLNRALNIHPNPTQGAVNWQLQLPSAENVQLIVTDALGRELIRENHRGTQFSQWINLSELPAGIYLFQLSVEDQRVTKRIIHK